MALPGLPPGYLFDEEQDANFKNKQSFSFSFWERRVCAIHFSAWSRAESDCLFPFLNLCRSLAPALQGPPAPSDGEAAVPPGPEAPCCVAEPPLCPGEEGQEAAVVYGPKEMLPEDPPVVVRTPAYSVELPPCHGVPGPTLGELPATEQEAIPVVPLEPMRELPIRGKCLIYNWQEEVRLPGLHTPGLARGGVTREFLFPSPPAFPK